MTRNAARDRCLLLLMVRHGLRVSAVTRRNAPPIMTMTAVSWGYLFYSLIVCHKLYICVF
jgi:hypothetical protein